MDARDRATAATRYAPWARQCAKEYGRPGTLSVCWTGGRPDADNMDCAIRALAIVSPLTYEQAREKIEAYTGRTFGKGTPTRALEGMLRQLAPRVQTTARTLAQFAAEHPTGVYYLLVRAHAVAMIDGRLVDNGRINGPRTRLEGAYKFAD